MTMRAFLSLLFLIAFGIGGFAGDIQKGATMQVKPNSIWFADAAELTHWQQLKTNGNPAALASYQDKMLSNRDAWQFSNQLTVKIIGYEPAKNQVKVEMTTAGRLVGTTWMLDADALVQ
jgi:hypothetical protein